jgi:hypothetical protein
MNCVCGHEEKEHVPGGKCRVPDCSCEMFQPGVMIRTARRLADTAFPGSRDPNWGGVTAPRAARRP